jgi:hypothetical protein
MSVIKTATTALAALSLVAVPTIAAAAPAVSKLSVAAGQRVGAPVAKSNKAGGSSIIIAVLAAAAVIAGIVIASDGNSKPTSS